MSDETKRPPKNMMTVRDLRRVLWNLPDGSEDWPVAVLLPDGAAVTPAAVGDFNCQKHGMALAFDCRPWKGHPADCRGCPDCEGAKGPVT